MTGMTGSGVSSGCIAVRGWCGCGVADRVPCVLGAFDEGKDDRLLLPNECLPHIGELEVF